MAGRRQTREAPTPKYKVDSVLDMTISAIKTNLGIIPPKSKRKPGVHSRSVAPRVVAKYEAMVEASGLTPEEAVEFEEFFDEPWGTSPIGWTLPEDEASKPKLRATQGYARMQENGMTIDKAGEKDQMDGTATIQPRRTMMTSTMRSEAPTTVQKKQAKETSSYVLASRRRRHEDSVDGDRESEPSLLKNFGNANRKQAGLSLVGKCFGVTPKQKKGWKPKRPYFTWWVTIVQLIVFIVSVAVYGIAPIGIDKTEIQDQVLTSSLAIEQVSYFEEDNLWIGPREEDLIHLGAKYSPCMRVDKNVEDVLALDRVAENETACCIRNDGSGCLQTAQADCQNALTIWNKWTTSNLGYQDRISGSVCGQDPKYCEDPSSVEPFVWPDDITQWPLCVKTANVTQDVQTPHMTCEVVGRPCCIGIQGECIITTREFCDFRKGYFHDEAALCSQVACMNEICGMTPFLHDDKPDQFYRLFSAQFLHGGVVTLLVTIVFQMLIQRDIEKIIGWWRMAIIYMGGGVSGTLASAIFLPYHVEAGPSGCQFAVLAALFVEVFRWTKDDQPGRTMGKLIGVILLLFIIGLLPMFDNWAHLFGLAFGALLSIGFRPFASMCNKAISRPVKIVCILVMVGLAIWLFVLLLILFYVYEVYECEYCAYFTCVPITDTFCESQHVTIARSQGQTQ